MPLTVLVRNPGGDGESPALTFDGDRIVLGRGAFADVRLPDPSVSTRHATVRAIAGEYLLYDEGSTNGTFVGGVRLAPQTPRTLRSGDLVRLGRVWIEARTDPAPLTHDLPLATRDLAFRLVVGDDTAPSVAVVEGADLGTSLTLSEEGRVYLVGRGDTCALLLSDADASREHVQMVRRGGSVLVQDLGGKNCAALGEGWLSTDRPVIWRRPAMLRVGRTVLALTEPVADALAELETANDEPLPEGASIAPPPPSSRAAIYAAGAAAPIAGPSRPAPPLAEGAPVPSLKRRKPDGAGWSSTDLAVGAAAVMVIALSAAGLYWLLRT
jgi:pSer/pThr/pTyr-binding forkhead associated (FHA) protein